MPLFMEVHNGLPADERDERLTEAYLADRRILEKHHVRYVDLWLDKANGKIFCLVEAPNADAAHAVRREAHGPLADEIYNVQPGRRGRPR